MTIAEILQEHGIPTVGDEHHHVRPGRTGWDCPYCSPGSGRFRMSYPGRGWRSGCWTCGWMSLADVLRDLTNLPIGKCIEMVKEINSGWAPLPQHQATGKLVIPTGVEPMGKAHRRYLEQRGFDPAYCEEVWGIKGIGLAPRLSWRLFLPITHRGKMVSWTTRAISNDVERRYLNASPEEEAMPAKHVLFGADLATHAVVVSEGQLDAIALGAGGVATSGLSYSREQVTLLSRFPQRTICMDAGPAAQEVARRLCQALSCYPGRTLRIQTETGKDLSRVSKNELQEIRKRYLT